MAGSLFRLLFGGVSCWGRSSPARKESFDLGVLVAKLEEEGRDAVEEMEDVEFEREWKVVFDVQGLPSGELGQEL